MRDLKSDEVADIFADTRKMADCQVCMSAKKFLCDVENYHQIQIESDPTNRLSRFS